MDTSFSPLFLQILIVGSLVWTLVGAIALILLLRQDWKNKKIW